MALKKLNFTAKTINADICSNLAVTASFEMSKYSLGSVYTWVLEKIGIKYTIIEIWCSIWT